MWNARKAWQEAFPKKNPFCCQTHFFLMPQVLLSETETSPLWNRWRETADLERESRERISWVKKLCNSEEDKVYFFSNGILPAKKYPIEWQLSTNASCFTTTNLYKRSAKKFVWVYATRKFTTGETMAMLAGLGKALFHSRRVGWEKSNTGNKEKPNSISTSSQILRTGKCHEKNDMWNDDVFNLK